jgi:hypothetical protein
MHNLWTKLLGLIGLISLLVPEVVLAAAEKAAPLVIVADTRKLTGWEAYWANLYNESHAYFTLVTVVAIPVIGLVFGVIADFLMSRIGIDLKSRELAEH